MIDLADCQKAIVQSLKSDIVLSGIELLGSSDNIKEFDYQSSDFTYPAVRVDMGLQTPIGNGTDHLILSNYTWRILVFDETKSSKKCNKILTRVKTHLFNRQLIGTDENNVYTFFINHINCISTENATRLNERLWLAIGTFDARLNDLNHL